MRHARQVAALQNEVLEHLSETTVSACLFDALELAAIALSFEMTAHVQFSDETFAAACTALRDGQQVVELIGIIAAYNKLSRFLVALGIKPEALQRPARPSA